jgi:hypothetical protein
MAGSMTSFATEEGKELEGKKDSIYTPATSPIRLTWKDYSHYQGFKELGDDEA